MDKIIEYIKEFGIKIFFITSITRVLRKIRIKQEIIEKVEKWKYKKIIAFLNQKYKEDIVIPNIKSEGGYISKSSPIWIFWWQGEKFMPDIVKACYNSVKKNKNQHTVNLITKENIKKYVHFDDDIYNKVENGNISLTHFSDIIREKLLYEYGGIWMDATIYMTSPFPEKMYRYDYYTLKGAFEYWKWTGFFQASTVKNTFPYIISHLFDLYWKEHSQLITYLLIDCLFTVAYMNCNEVKKKIDKLENTDNSVFCLNDKLLDEKYDEEILKKLDERSNIHKLSYKYKHNKLLNDEITFYGKLLQEID